MSHSNRKQIVLITGANRGIGLGLSTQYLARPDTTVIASVRNPGSSSSKGLHSLPKGHGSELIVIRNDMTSATDASAAVNTLQSTYQISRLDCVIANASIQNLVIAPLESVDPSQLQEHISGNAVGTLMLFQAMFPLLQKSSQPKFVLLGSPIGSIGGMDKRPVPMSAYGVSKAAAHYLVRKMHFENKGLIAFAVDPGFVQTEAGNKAAQIFGMEQAATPVKESVDFLMKTIDNATRETASGHFPSIDGGEWMW